MSDVFESNKSLLMFCVCGGGGEDNLMKYEMKRMSLWNRQVSMIVRWTETLRLSFYISVRSVFRRKKLEYNLVMLPDVVNLFIRLSAIRYSVPYLIQTDNSLFHVHVFSVSKIH